ncbi:MAG TPA: Uma2 family endonuclease [Pyrinomonadaceae bacterium]|nr:Uma2 family endonuclease [Pyrinomonadaceae bacterium]
MSSLPKTYLTPEEYLAFERQCEYKNEYYNGEVFAMTGASLRHNTITLNISGELRQQLKGRPCVAHASEMRVQIPHTTNYFYPDVVVTCGEPQLADSYFDTLLNPTLVVEVLSPSTEAFDRGRKFEQYRKIGSLMEYVLVAQDRVHVERYGRQPQGDWLLSEFNDPEGTLKLTSVECELSMSEIYRNVRFED